MEGEAIPSRYDEEDAQLTFIVPVVADRVLIDVRFQNLYKNSNFPSSFELVRESSGELRFGAVGERRRTK